MSEKIILICPNKQKGSPANERFLSFVNFFKNKGCQTLVCDFPVGFFSQLNTIFFILKNRPKYIFISQPPFKFWMLFFIPFFSIILDLRDGWSISIKSGYGGTVKPKKIKYYFVSFVEFIMFSRSKLIVTCTEGLKGYIENKYKKDVIMVKNGISRENFNLIESVAPIKSNDDYLVFTCVGQFSEYGVEKVKLVIDTISKRYSDFKCLIRVVGASQAANEWLNNYVKNFKNINYEYISKVEKKELYSILKSSDYAIAIIRDPNYDYGTKIFEYIASGIKVLNYFPNENNFVNNFSGCFDTSKCNYNKSVIREEGFIDFDKEFSRRLKE